MTKGGVGEEFITGPRFAAPRAGDAVRPTQLKNHGAIRLLGPVKSREIGLR